MKISIRICLSLCAAALFATPANAQFYNPWSGWWGAGYYGSPAYYTPSYTSFYRSSSYGCCGTAAPVYAVGYGSGCCAPSCCATDCCDPCGAGCASGSCAGSTPAGSLKPAQDPISDRKSPDYEDDTRSRRFDPDATPRTKGTDDLLDPVESRDRTDMFDRPKAGTGSGSGSGSTADPPMFNDSVDPATERTNQKPPMTDPLDGKPVDQIENPDPGKPVDEKTFFDDATRPDNTAALLRESVIARTGSLSEVLAPKRLASRSLPANLRATSGSKLADKSNNTKSDSPRPLRWISAPLAEGHVQL